MEKWLYVIMVPRVHAIIENESKMKTTVYYNLGFISIALAIISVDYDNIFLTKGFVEILK